jgi:hypothetical protein
MLIFGTEGVISSYLFDVSCAIAGIRGNRSVLDQMHAVSILNPHACYTATKHGRSIMALI